MAKTKETDQTPVWKKRHREWTNRRRRLKWLWDSYVGGDPYREADYGMDSRGFPIRNLRRHKRDYPQRIKGNESVANYGRQAGLDPAATATESDYDMRWARTPVYKFMGGAIRKHLSKIYARQPHRKGPDALMKFWKDVNGCGVPIEKWMSDVFAPVLLSLSNVDILFTHPDRPDDEPIANRADEIRLNLDGCVATVIMPWDMVWWKLNKKGRYVECVVAESDDQGCFYYRHWTATDWTLYDSEGEIEGTAPHPYKRVPIGRAIDVKDPTYHNTGLPRYEEVAEYQREHYNKDSELILSDTTQAHPLLQGPDDYCVPGSLVTIGPSNLLPKKKMLGTDGYVVGYEPFEVLDFPKGGADSIRTNKNDLIDQIDRAACLTKPAGTAGTSGATVGQTAESKSIDQGDGNAMLGEIAGCLAAAEMLIAEFVLVITGDGAFDQADLDSVQIGYSKEFDLTSTTDLATGITTLQTMVGGASDLPFTMTLLITDYAHRLLTGKDSDTLAKVDAEIEAAIAKNILKNQQQAEMNEVNVKLDANGNPVEPDNPDPAPDDPPPVPESKREEPPVPLTKTKRKKSNVSAP